MRADVDLDLEKRLKQGAALRIDVDRALSTFRARRERRRTRRRVAATAVSLTVTVAVVALLVALGQRQSPPQIPSGASPNLTTTTVARTGLTPRGISTYDGRSIWMAAVTRSGEGGLLLRSTASDSARIPTDRVASRVAAAADGGVWVANEPTFGASSLIGPDGSRDATVDGLAGPIVLAGQHLWGTTEGANSDVATLVSFDLASGAMDRQPLDRGVFDMTSWEGRVFLMATDTGPGGSVRGSLVEVGNTGPREVLADLTPGVLVAGPSGIWVRSNQGQLCAWSGPQAAACIDPGDGWPVAETAAGLWCIASRDHRPVLLLLDPITGATRASVALHSSPADLFPPSVATVGSSDSLLIAESDGVVQRVDATNVPPVGGPRRSSAPASTRRFEDGGITWTLSSQAREGRRCVSVSAESATDSATLGEACGEDDGFSWGIGGLEIAGEWFNVAYGGVPHDAASVSVRTGAGATKEDHGFADASMWIVPIPGTPLSESSDIARVVVLGEGGVVLKAFEPPSIVDYRRQALGDAHPTGSGT